MGLRGKIIGVFFIGFSLLALPMVVILKNSLTEQRFWEVAALIVMLLVLGAALLYFSVQALIMQQVLKLDRDLSSIWRNGRWAERLSTASDNTEGDKFNALSQSINQLLALIRKQSVLLESIALTDPLTQIANRRAFEERIVIEMSLHQRNRTPLSVLIINVDEFNRYLDYYGSPTGDETLRIIGQLLSQIACRPADLSARISNEEFALVLPSTDLDGACHVADILSARMAERRILHANSEVADQVTLSIGVAMAGTEDGATFIQRAEKARYNAQQSGRNTIAALRAG